MLHLDRGGSGLGGPIVGDRDSDNVGGLHDLCFDKSGSDRLVDSDYASLSDRQRGGGGSDGGVKAAEDCLSRRGCADSSGDGSQIAIRGGERALAQEIPGGGESTDCSGIGSIVEVGWDGSEVEVLPIDIAVDSLAVGVDGSGDVNVDASSVDFILAERKARINARSSRPVPDPVQSQNVARGEVVRDLHISLAPESFAHWSVGIMGEDTFAILRDVASGGVGISQVAAAIVEVFSGEKTTTSITASTIGVPDIVDVKELFVIAGLGSAVDEDGTAIGGLADLVPRLSDVTILLIAKSNGSASGSRETRAADSLIVASSLGRMTHGKTGIHRSGTIVGLIIGRQKPDHVRITKPNNVAKHIATRVARFTDKSTVGSDFNNLFSPAMADGEVDASQKQKPHEEACKAEDKHVARETRVD